MDYDSHADRSPICASVPHYAVGLSVWFCPHRQSWFGEAITHDEEGSCMGPWCSFDLGPFDSYDEVVLWACRQLHEAGQTFPRLPYTRRESLNNEGR